MAKKKAAKKKVAKAEVEVPLLVRRDQLSLRKASATKAESCHRRMDCTYYVQDVNGKAYLTTTNGCRMVEVHFDRPIPGAPKGWARTSSTG